MMIDLATLNRYRDQHNPVRGLTISRAISLCEAYPRGEFADLMWTFGAPFLGIECSDADLLALIERRTSPLLEMDWDSLVMDRDGIDQVLAQEQQAFIRELMDGIDNLYAAIEHLELAAFRGFSHCEVIPSAADPLMIEELRVVDQWNIVRDGSRGRWKYNPAALQASFQSLPEDFLIDPRTWLIREVRRPIGRVALIKFIRESLCDKDWDAFLEIYGIPSGIIIGPPNVPADREGEFRDAADEVAKGGSGYLPNGSSYVANDSPRGVNPFDGRLKRLSEKLILAGTGGKLTMLAESGSGTLAGGAHAETFAVIAKGAARKISELVQDQLVKQRVQARWPGRPVLAYWQLAMQAETNTSEIVQDASTLAAAGYLIDVAELSERTGYTLTLKPQAPAVPAVPGAAFNRASSPAQPEGNDSQALLAHALAEDLAPVRDLIEEHLDDPEELLRVLEAQLPDLFEQARSSGATDEALLSILATEVANGVAEANAEIGGSVENGRKRDHWKRDGDGQFSDTEGANPAKNIKAGDAAIDMALRRGRSVHGAMERKEVGKIDFEWGHSGDQDNDFKTGYGLAHIKAKHGEKAVRDLPTVIAKGDLTPHPTDPTKWEIHYQGKKAVLGKRPKQRAAVITSFEPGKH